MRSLIAVAVLVGGLALAPRWPAALVAALPIAWLLAGRSRPARGYERVAVAVHTHGGHGTKTAARHEAGHVRMTRAVGGRVHSAYIYPDGSGITHLDLPKNITAAQRIAVDVSGEVAAGTRAGCSSDQAYMRQALAALPAAQRAAAKRDGYRLARRTVGGWIFDGGVSTTAAELRKKGSVKF